jgi:hypothetical protein
VHKALEIPEIPEGCAIQRMKESRSNRLSFVDTQEASSSGVSEHLTMSSFPPAIVPGGLVVPLYLIVVSIIGATVSIARAGNKALAGGASVTKSS